ncbi:MAG: TolB family protein [Planctomycetota bacterium]|jgi:hypothetical protein
MRTQMLTFLATTLTLASCAAAQRQQPPPTAEWAEAERGILEHHVQLTSPQQFVKAGESYFSPDDSMVIFQAVEAPPAGEQAEEFYGMFVAEVVRDQRGRITGLDGIRRLSPPGSANTCGWFHPTEPGVVIFGSTLGPPSESTPPGYQRASGRYRWMFPPEMRVVRTTLDTADGTAASLEVIAGDGSAYCAEGSFSADGRHLLYCSLESGEGDIFIKDMQTGRTTRVVPAAGYDGGPFFSADGRRICYRSDRRGDNHLQLFVSDLAFDDAGTVIGVEREYQLTDNDAVNWCPFWTPDGRHLVYATSEQGHRNYEIYLVDADPGDLPGSSGTIRYGVRKRRVTNAPGADVLPAFTHDGRTMIWTGQRDATGTSQLWAADFVMQTDEPVRVEGEPRLTSKQEDGGPPEEMMHVTDPDTGIIYVYDMEKHEVVAYDPATHETRPVTDPAEMERATELFRLRDEP